VSQNLISLSFSSEDLNAIDNALGVLEKHFSCLISLSAEERITLARMGRKSETFCRQTLNVLSLNPHIIPPSFNLKEAQSDLANIDLLRPRFTRLHQLIEKADSSEMALGSDVMSAALEGYALLKVAGKGHGLEAVRHEIGARFSKRSRASDPTPAPSQQSS
jgi:hypothetical protein